MKKSHLRKLAAIAAASLVAGVASAALASVPPTLTHQGRLFDAQGKPVDGKKPVTFNFYTDQNGNVPAVSETLDVTFEDGYFSVSLGEQQSLSTLFTDGKPKYLGITVDNDAEMTPRATVQSVPYAMVAGDAIGDIHPTSISVNNTTVIDQTGKWVGPSTGLVGPTGPAGPAGPAGAAGATGAAGPMGPAGSQGPAGAPGAAGPQGPQGTAGPTGAAGATGATGPQGPQGIPGVVGSYMANGLGNSPTATLDFIGPTVMITVAAGQKVIVTSNKALGSTLAGGATGLNLYMCYKSTAAGSSINSDSQNGSFGQQVPQNTRMLFGLSAVFTGLPAGTYFFGMCGASANFGNWNNNEYGYTTALVTL